jgi:hypothetical protein
MIDFLMIYNRIDQYMATVDINTLQSLSIESVFEGRIVGKGTGFVIQNNGVNYLITNWHVVTGRNPLSGQPLNKTTAIADPDKLIIWHHLKGLLGNWISKETPLLDNGNPTWLEHPLGKQIDVVALPLNEEPDVDYYPINLSLKDTDILIIPSEIVSVIGFPFGSPSDGKLPFWITGYVATDIELDYGGKPIFYINATTEKGMSGSPVMALRPGMYRDTNNSIHTGGATKFLGIYSGRMRDDFPQIGIVWKPKVIEEIFSSIRTDLK